MCSEASPAFRRTSRSPSRTRTIFKTLRGLFLCDTAAIHPRKAFRFSACPPHPPDGTFPSKGKAGKSRLSVGDSLPDAPHASLAQFMSKVIHDFKSIHARKRCSFTTPPSRFASTPPLAQGRQEPYLRPACDAGAIHPRKAFRFSACPPHPPNGTFPSKGKAGKSRLSVGGDLPDAPHASLAQFMSKVIHDFKSIHAHKRCSFTTSSSRFASTPPLAQGRPEPYLRPLCAAGAVHPRKASRFSACPPHPPDGTFPSKGKALLEASP